MAMLDLTKRALFPELDNIADYLTHYARIYPDREAVVAGGIRWTYAELDAKVDELAAILQANGIGPGDRVATLSTPHPDYWRAFLATVRIGAIWLGLNPRYQLAELRHVVADAEPSVVLARTRIEGRDYTEVLQQLAQIGRGTRIIALDQSDVFEELANLVGSGLASAFPRAEGGSSPALIVYTSGSTGKPKGAMLTHRGLVITGRTQNAIWHVPDMRILNNLPINHIGCVGDICCATLIAGGTIVFQERFDPAGVLRLIETERLTSWGQVPTMFQMSLAAGDAQTHDLSSLRAITWEGAAAPRALVEQLHAICPHLGNAYGLTETVGCVTFTPLTNDRDLLADTVGFPVPDFDFRIVDPQGAAAADDEIGEIQVRGAFVLAGYWRNPEATAAAFTADGWFRTGDLASRRADGAIRLVGRIREMYKSGGYNVYPREVEVALEAVPGVHMAAVIGHPDRLFGELGHAFLLADLHLVTEAKVRAALKGQLANYKHPKTYTLAESLPLLPVGKIDKVALRAQLLETTDA